MTTPNSVKEMLHKMETRNQTPYQLGHQAGLNGEHPDNYNLMSLQWKQGHLKGSIERGKKRLEARLK